MMSRFSWNPWHGCRKFSAGCQNCYVYYLDSVRGKDANIITRSASNFNLPLKKDRSGDYKIKSGTEVYTCFTSDFFLEEADEWRQEAWQMIKTRFDLTFLICTKRVHRIESCIPPDWENGYNNVILAVTCEDQNAADNRLPIFRNIKAKRKYIFAAPLLESIVIDPYLSEGWVDLVSVCGESYDNARDCHFEWVKSLYTACQRFHTPFVFHQTGSKFVMNGKRYHIEHSKEYSQAKKAMEYLRQL